MTETQQAEVGGNPAERTYEPAANVIEALARCIADVQAVGKAGYNKEQNYSFRGVDAVVNAVHPVLARHRVVIVPHAAAPRYTAVTAKSGKAGRFIDLELTYRIYGPGGPEDHIDAVVFGESADYGDKATAKAFSVGYRICLLQVMNLPTDDPDPDSGPAFEHVTSRAAATAAIPDESRDLGEARTRVQAAWNFQFGPWVKEQGEALFTKVVGGALTEATAGDLRKFAAYLASLPPKDAGSTPSTAEQPPAEGSDASRYRDPSAPLSDAQRVRIIANLKEMGITERQDRLEWMTSTLGRKVSGTGDLTMAEAGQLIETLNGGVTVVEDQPTEGGEPDAE